MEGEDRRDHRDCVDLLPMYMMDMENMICGEINGGDHHRSNNNYCVNYVDFLDNNNDCFVANNGHGHGHRNRLRHCFSVDGFSGFSSSNDNNNNNNNDNNANNNNKNVNNTNNNGSKIRKNNGEAKKAMSPSKLAELWIADPKRAKRILANRQSAARSKERKARYMVELEKKVQALQTEATALTAQLSLFERDTSGLSSENTELRRQLESMEQQAQLRDALNDALQQELDRLKVATGETTTTTTDSFIIPCANSQQTTHPFDFINVSCAPPLNTAISALHGPYHPTTADPNMLLYQQTMPPPQMYDDIDNNGSQLGSHLPQFPVDSSSESPSTMTNQDQLSRLQGLDLSGRGSRLISSENMGF